MLAVTFFQSAKSDFYRQRSERAKEKVVPGLNHHPVKHRKLQSTTKYDKAAS